MLNIMDLLSDVLDGMTEGKDRRRGDQRSSYDDEDDNYRDERGDRSSKPRKRKSESISDALWD